MLGGIEVTAKAREHAKEMLKNASESAPPEAKKAAAPKRRS